MHETQFVDYLQKVAKKFGFTGVTGRPMGYKDDTIYFPSSSEKSKKIPQVLRDQPAEFFAFFVGSITIGTENLKFEQVPDGTLIRIKGSKSYEPFFLLSHEEALLAKTDEILASPDAEEKLKACIADFEAFKSGPKAARKNEPEVIDLSRTRRSVQPSPAARQRPSSAAQPRYSFQMGTAQNPLGVVIVTTCKLFDQSLPSAAVFQYGGSLTTTDVMDTFLGTLMSSPGMGALRTVSTTVGENLFVIGLTRKNVDAIKKAPGFKVTEVKDMAAAEKAFALKDSGRNIPPPASGRKSGRRT